MKGFSVEGELGFSNASRRYTSGSDDLVMANVHAIQYANFVDLKPYMLMGPGLKTGHVTTMGPSFWVGLYIPVKQMAVRLEGRNTYFFEQEHLGREQSKHGIADRYDHCPNSPKGARVNKRGCLVSVTLDVKFPSNQAVVLDAYLPQIEAFATYISAKKSTIEVQGHTDDTGNEAYNIELSEKRAQAVRELLATRFGVPSERVSFIGYGSAQPVVSNDSAENRAKNRRIEIKLIK